MACFNLRAGGVSLSSTANLAQPSMWHSVALVWFGVVLLCYNVCFSFVSYYVQRPRQATLRLHPSYFIIHDAHEYTGEPTPACCGPLNPMGSHPAHQAHQAHLRPHIVGCRWRGPTRPLTRPQADHQRRRVNNTKRRQCSSRRRSIRRQPAPTRPPGKSSLWLGTEGGKKRRWLGLTVAHRVPTAKQHASCSTR